jgi:hypothetical protein
MGLKHEALDTFRKMVSFLYREVGMLKRRNHPELADEAKLKGTFFSHQRKTLAKQFCHQTMQMETPAGILAPYESNTGLTLEDRYRIFAEGDWRIRYGDIAYGGPSWAKIAKAALRGCV